MKYSPNMLDALTMKSEEQTVSLRVWIHQQLKFTFLSDISDDVLDKMEEKDLTDLVDSLKYF